MKFKKWVGGLSDKVKNWYRSLDKPQIKQDLLQLSVYTLIYALAIVFWESLLYFHMGVAGDIGLRGYKFYYLMFVPAQALLLAFCTGWFKAKGNRIATPVVMALPWAYYVSQLVYYRIFGSLISMSMVGLGGNAIKNFGWALWTTVVESWVWILVTMVPLIAAIIISVFFSNKIKLGNYRKWLHGAAFGGVIILWVVAVLCLGLFGKGDGSAYEAYHNRYVDTDTGANRLGALTNSVVEVSFSLFGADAGDKDAALDVPDMPAGVVDPLPEPEDPKNLMGAIDFGALYEKAEDDETRDLCEYFMDIPGTNKNEYTGLLKDYNLIYICAESFSSYAIDPVITPTLYKLSQGGFKLNNYYNAYKNTTTNGEFSFVTGLWPDVSRAAKNGTAVGSFAQSADNFLPYGLGTLFEAAGIPSRAYHNYLGEYYCRLDTHANLGYTTKFMSAEEGDGGMTFTYKWPSSDLEMMEQSIDEFINEKQFHTYYMTFSGHGPYADSNPMCVQNMEYIESMTEGRELSESAKYYLAANYELEKAMAYLMERLEQAGKQNNTLIVLAADHYPYYLLPSSYNILAGEKVEANFGRYKSTCIMWCGGMEPVEVDTPCCNVDILPTVLNLFGIEFDSRLLAGSDIFASTPHMATLYNKSFITDKVKYNAQNGVAIWDEEASLGMTEEEKAQYLEYHKSLVKSRYVASLSIMECDFFRFVYEQSGIIPITEESEVSE